MIRIILKITNLLLLFILISHSAVWSESVKDRLKNARQESSSSNPADTARKNIKQPVKSSHSAENIILTPESGTIVYPGQTINIKVELPSNATVDGVLFTFDKNGHSIEGSGPYEFPYEIPKNRLGKIDIYAYTFGPQQNYEAHSKILVQANQELTDIEVLLMRELLNQPEGFTNIRVNGHYADGTKARISEHEAGTTYQLKSGTENVVSITKDGIIRTQGEGKEEIIITNGSISKKILIDIVFRKPTNYE